MVINILSFDMLRSVFSFSLVYSLYLTGFGINLALPIKRTPLNHSYGYDSAGVSQICFARFPECRAILSSGPFMNYPG
jgi:hypothetical protein